MIHLPGYKIKEEVSRGGKSTILRGIRISDQFPVIIKLLNKEHPSSIEQSTFIREYEILKKITGDRIINVYGVENHNNSVFIVLEDIGGESVDKVLQSKRISIDEKLSLAIQMANSLIQIHQNNIVHKDINPTNFIWNYKTNQLKIIDFGISAELIRETSQCINLNVLEGSLDYLSPEQTGRINRPIDYRTDLYSLGISYYEIFTGQLPFKGNDDLEKIYSHIAKIPDPPREINPEIPAIISNIVMKLISKTVEDRYQSAMKLKTDLEYCRQLPEEKREICDFALGERDYGDRFEIPHKLYGREAEIDILNGGFKDAADGHCGIVLVSGYSGIGKSSLIHEIRKPITGKKGYFISGKYNQFERDIPYSGLIQAFQQLIRQLLAQPQSVLDNWKRCLTNALGCNGQVIIDIIPELEQIIGPQPPAVGLNPLEAKNRFQIVFSEFINVFAAREHPLVIFLDDLQWSDTSTLDLLKYTLGTTKKQFILFIGAYRDNDVTTTHPLIRLIEEMKKWQQQDPTPQLREIYLKPLGFFNVNHLISDTFHSHPAETEPLTNIIYQKTRGNPFFISRLLNTLYLQGIFSFHLEKGQWTYDLEKVKNVEISDNVIDLLVTDLKSLPLGTIDILKLAAFIGTQFDLAILSAVSKKSTTALGKDLWIAIEKEIILPLDNNYRYVNTLKDDVLLKSLEIRFSFAHDRIRQSVYSFASDSEKAEMHLHIGRAYLTKFRETKRTEMIFDLVNHLNIGSSLIVEKDDRTELTDLNIMAGNKAKKSTAFAVALNYFETAGLLMSTEEWAEKPAKLFNLLLEQATSALLSGDLIKADSVCGNLSKIAVSNLEKGALANVKVLLFTFQGKLVETISEIRKTLRLFNIYLPESTEEIDQKMQDGIVKMQQFLANTPVEELVNFPVMDDPEKLMAMQLLFQVIPSVRQVNPKLYFWVSLKMFELTFTYGVSPLSCKCLVDCGVIQGKVLTDYKTGYKLGEAAFALANKLKAESQKSSVYFIFPFLSYWMKHYQESLDYYDMSCRSGLETGDLMHVTYAVAHRVHLFMWIGKNLTETKEETENATAFLKQTKSNVPLVLAEIVHFTIQKLQAIPELNDQKYFEEKDREMITRIDKIHNITYLARFYQYNTYVNIIMDDMEAAEKWNRLADEIIYSGVSDFPLSDHFLFKGMILISKFKRALQKEQKEIKKSLYNIQKKIEEWAQNCPSNFAHKYYLLAAEMAIIENESFDIVIDFFNKAMNSFVNNDFLHLKALCYELYGKFWIDKNDQVAGKAYIREADYLYKKWGAHRKVILLEKKYSQCFISDETVLGGKELFRIKKGITSTVYHTSIDMISILKSTQAISSEIKIEKLLRILIRTMIENAGAQRGCLLLKNEVDNQFYVEAVQDNGFCRFYDMQSINFTDSRELCSEIVNYVTRTMENVVVQNASTDTNWQNCPYVIENRIKSVLCMPVVYQNKLKGVVYLENNLSDNVFTSDRLEILNILSSQASIAIENARLYENMEEKVRERTVQLNNANEKLKELSLHDPLTNLHNRRYAFEFIGNKINQFIKNKAVSLHKHEKRSLSIRENVIGVFLIDIDHFKIVNDTYGHSAGDTVLITVSEVLKKMIRSEDILVRWGGEEFLIILYNTNPDYLATFSLKILKEMRTTPIRILENEFIHKTCSLGYVEMPFDSANPELLNLEQMINISDYALYCAKENGRNCAARFLKKDVEIKGDLKSYLVNLSKSTKLDEKYFQIEYIRPE